MMLKSKQSNAKEIKSNQIFTNPQHFLFNSTMGWVGWFGEGNM
jgi:hypothetical protein